LEGPSHSAGDVALFQMIEREVPKGRLLEIGAAGGDFLVAARSRGWDVTGVELSPVAAASARERFGLDVRTGSVQEASLPPAAFDVVYMGDVLEHVPDPAADLRVVRALLRPRGIVVVAGPTTIHSLLRRTGLATYRLLHRTKILRAPPYHLWEFTPHTLKGLLEECGFRVLRERAGKIPPWLPGTARRTAGGPLAWPIEAFNYLVTMATGAWGDRLIVLARHEAAR
jgi:SAM-dependent methyltransferase